MSERLETHIIKIEALKIAAEKMLREAEELALKTVKRANGAFAGRLLDAKK